ncbi:MAG: hypothetical protein AAF517_02055 [Planctomycetota bacterium]
MILQASTILLLACSVAQADNGPSLTRSSEAPAWTSDIEAFDRQLDGLGKGTTVPKRRRGETYRAQDLGAKTFVDLKHERGSLQRRVSEAFQERVVRWEFELAQDAGVQRAFKTSSPGGKGAFRIRLAPKMTKPAKASGLSLQSLFFFSTENEFASKLKRGTRVTLEGRIASAKHNANRARVLLPPIGPLVLYPDDNNASPVVSVGLKRVTITHAKKKRKVAELSDAWKPELKRAKQVTPTEFRKLYNQGKIVHSMHSFTYLGAKDGKAYLNARSKSLFSKTWSDRTVFVDLKSLDPGFRKQLPIGDAVEADEPGK